MSLPPSTRIGAVAIQIADLDRSLAFYRDILGFRELRRDDIGHARTAQLGVSGSDVTWLELREKRGVKRIPRGGLLGLYHFAVLLPTRSDLGRFLVNAVNAGLQVASANHLVSEALYLTDPDGITVEVYRDLPRSEWSRNGEEISMATLPLDVDALVASVESGASWQGMPAGTTMGHMHFYVGALDEADAFYHEALGFDRMVWSFPGALFVSAGGYHHHVGLNTWAAHARVATDDDARLICWEMVVQDPETIDQIGERLRAGGYSVTAHEGNIESTDAWGIVVRVR